jgi:hypothetical protein
LIKSSGAVLQTIWWGLALGTVVALIFGRFSLAFVSTATLCLSLLPLALAHRLSVRLPVSFLLVIPLFIFASIFLGEAFDFYNRFWWWDWLLHGSAQMGVCLLVFLFVFMLFEGTVSPPHLGSLLNHLLRRDDTWGPAWERVWNSQWIKPLSTCKESGLMIRWVDLIVNGIGAVFAAWWDFFMSATRCMASSPSVEQSSSISTRTTTRKALDRLKR